MHRDETIVAVSTPLGQGGIAVIRLSGHQAVAIVKKTFRTSKSGFTWETHRACHGWIMEGEEPVDEVVVTVFRSPHSYTGEDVVEVSCHGGVFVVKRVVERMVRGGARPAEPGEFTQRAFLHGKMDLSQAEAVADLIQAKTEAARRVAAYQLEGRLSERLAEMRERLTHACSLVELELDFSEEDVEFASRQEMTGLIRDLRKELRDLSESFHRGRVCREGVRMVVLGKPNVGKSSILNCLVEKERAIVAETPGTTRDTVEDVLDIEGVLFTITDTAGIRETKDPVEREGVRRAEKAFDEASLVLLVFDGSEPFSAEDEGLIRKVREGQKTYIPVVNKIDLVQQLPEDALKAAMPDETIVRISALKRRGIQNLIEALEETALSGGLPHEGEVVLTNVRHHQIVIEAEAHLKSVAATLKKEMSQEFIAVDLRGALDSLGRITGQVTTEDILNRIFSQFCIGK